MKYGISTNTFNQSTLFKFASSDDARKWLKTETYSFSTREIVTRRAAEKIFGKKEVERAEMWEEARSPWEK